MLVRNEYPRPQMRRKKWMPLNGIWEFDFDDENTGIAQKLYDGKTTFSKTINVPFTYQYQASGIGDETFHATMWYKRSFTLTPTQRKHNALLCFNGADYLTDVWINGRHVCQNKGAYTPFCVDITPYVGKSNTIVVRCFDPLDETLPRGKQSWTNERFGCWYIPNSGIWQSVWIEFFDADCVENYFAAPDTDNCCFYGEIDTLHGRATSAAITVSFKGKIIASQQILLLGRHSTYCVSLQNTPYKKRMQWSVNHPNLLDVEIRLLQNDTLCDVVHTRLGMRKISVEDGKWCINGEPVYQRLILDQGYWKSSGITPPSCEALKHDIEISQAMGFNGARKHQKFEDPYFYYYAEEMGFLVWCEMPSAYKFVADEQLALMSEWQHIVKNARNFASIICYVPLNESWGVDGIVNKSAQQNFARAMYYATKSLDSTRLVSINDGWENISETDVVTIHDYCFDCSQFDKYRKENMDELYPAERKQMAFGNKYNGQPVVFSEFGGIAMQRQRTDENWGYNSGAATVEDFYARYGNLIKGITQKWFQGFCYTQLTDAQQEVNGLLDGDHNPKFDIETLCKLTRQ